MSHIRWFRPAGVIVLLLLLLGASVAASSRGEEERRAFREAMKQASSEEQAVLLRELAKEGYEGTEGEITLFLSSRHLLVRRAAIEALGVLGNRKSLGRLIPLLKTYKKDPDTLVLVIRSMGRLHDPKAIHSLSSLGRRWLPKDARVAGAVAEALGEIPSKKSVEGLIRMLEQTSPSLPSNSTKEISGETYRTLRKAEPAIVKALAKLTGWDFREASAWHRFWKTEKKRWKPGTKNEERSSRTIWRDPGCGFEIRRPSDLWRFDRSESKRDYRIYAERREGDRRTAAVWVFAYRERSGITPELKAEESLDRHHRRMRDIREKTVRVEDMKFAGSSAVRLTLTGMERSGSVVTREERFLMRGDIMFVIGSWRLSGLREAAETEIQSALDSFRLIK